MASIRVHFREGTTYRQVQSAVSQIHKGVGGDPDFTLQTDESIDPDSPMPGNPEVMVTVARADAQQLLDTARSLSCIDDATTAE